jgi:hypothetical protein
MTAVVPSGREHRGNSNIVLLLSLKLILLAFFILLNSLSEFEASKTQAVLESINRAFNGKIESADRTPAYSASLGALPEAEAKIREIGSLFEAIIPSSRAKSIRRAKAVRVELTAVSLFQPLGVRLRPGREILIQRLAQLLARDHPDGLTYELEVLFGVGAPPGSAEGAVTPNPQSLEVRRAAMLAQRLIGAGLPASMLSIGLLPRHPGTVRFVVRARQDPAASVQRDRGVE